MNELLEKCNEQADELVKEIEKFKLASVVNRATAESLEGVATAIKKTLGMIRPLADSGFLKLQYISIGLGVLNLAVLGGVIYWIWKISLVN